MEDMKKIDQRKFLGITTVGEKGQIVIPAEARKTMKLAKGRADGKMVGDIVRKKLG